MPYIWNSLKHEYKPMASFVKCARKFAWKSLPPSCLRKFVKSYALNITRPRPRNP